MTCSLFKSSTFAESPSSFFSFTNLALSSLSRSTSLWVDFRAEEVAAAMVAATPATIASTRATYSTYAPGAGVGAGAGSSFGLRAPMSSRSTVAQFFLPSSFGTKFSRTDFKMLHPPAAMMPA